MGRVDAAGGRACGEESRGEYLWPSWVVGLASPEPPVRGPDSWATDPDPPLRFFLISFFLSPQSIAVAGSGC